MSLYLSKDTKYLNEHNKYYDGEKQSRKVGVCEF